MLLMTMMLIN